MTINDVLTIDTICVTKFCLLVSTSTDLLPPPLQVEIVMPEMDLDSQKFQHLALF